MDLVAGNWTHELDADQRRGAEGATFFAVTARVSCSLGPFLVVAERDLYSPAGGPDSLQITSRRQRGEPGATGGITTETLRAVPMQELRRRMDQLVRETLQSRGDVPDLPARTDTLHDLAVFCAAYVNLVDSGHRQPLQRLSELTGVSRNTLSARIRRAREKGVLTRPTSTAAGGHLTEFGRSLLGKMEG